MLSTWRKSLQALVTVRGACTVPSCVPVAACSSVQRGVSTPPKKGGPGQRKRVRTHHESSLVEEPSSSSVELSVSRYGVVRVSLKRSVEQSVERVFVSVCAASGCFLAVFLAWWTWASKKKCGTSSTASLIRNKRSSSPPRCRGKSKSLQSQL